MMLHSHVLPYVRGVLVVSIGGDEVYLSDLQQVVLSKIR
jgi:hypothetical protein